MTTKNKPPAQTDVRKPSRKEIPRAISLLRKRLEEIREINVSAIATRDDPAIDALQKKANKTIADIFGRDSQDYRDYSILLDRAPISLVGPTPISEWRRGYEKGKATALVGLQTLIGSLEEELENPDPDSMSEPIEVESATGDYGLQIEAVAIIETICRRFPLFVRQLQRRYADRTAFDVKDEYDVQNLLHSLLVLFFDDVRPEEYTPSSAGKSARMDFLVSKESIVIEAKMTRPGLSGKEIGEQLILDVARYQSHPGCRMLVCLVYDPENRITNPRGIENDLSRVSDRLEVRVFIVPTGH